MKKSFIETLFGRFLIFLGAMLLFATVIGIPLAVLLFRMACNPKKAEKYTLSGKFGTTTLRVLYFIAGVILACTIIGVPVAFLCLYMAVTKLDENGEIATLKGYKFMMLVKISYARFFALLAGIICCVSLIGIPIGQMAFKYATSPVPKAGEAQQPIKPKRRKSNDIFRNSIQLFWVVLTNSYIDGFTGGASGKAFMYLGSLKHFCNPGLHCYSCPGTYLACPIGSLQAVANQYMSFPVGRVSLYVCGALAIYGSICGRMVCGFLCPFGLIQDLLNKIPFVFKVNKGFKGDRFLRMLKYVILAVFVFLLNILFINIDGNTIYDIWVENPAFCRYICPSGIIVAAFPQIALDDVLAHSPGALGTMFAVKLLIAIAVMILSIIMFRPFCKYICPLGAIYAFFNKFSYYRMRVDKNKCTNCGLCTSTCRMQAKVPLVPNDAECIRCGDCKTVCPHGAISFGFGGLPTPRKKKEKAAPADVSGIEFVSSSDSTVTPIIKNETDN